jgi:hypothetical protein
MSAFSAKLTSLDAFAEPVKTALRPRLPGCARSFVDIPVHNGAPIHLRKQKALPVTLRLAFQP